MLAQVRAAATYCSVGCVVVAMDDVFFYDNSYFTGNTTDNMQFFNVIATILFFIVAKVHSGCFEGSTF
jgi:hypothetical protein